VTPLPPPTFKNSVKGNDINYQKNSGIRRELSGIRRYKQE
jgi:hypothetical protein